MTLDLDETETAAQLNRRYHGPENGLRTFLVENNHSVE